MPVDYEARMWKTRNKPTAWKTTTWESETKVKW